MKRVEASVARRDFSETLSRVAYGKKRVVVKRHGRDVAAIVPMSDLDILEDCEKDGEGRPAASRRRSGPGE